MKNSNLAWAVVLAAIFYLLCPALAFAAEPEAKNPCDDIADLDDRHLCLATQKTEGKTFGYSNKDHSSYYCSLVKSRDKKNYCYAVTKKTSSMCGLIVDKKLEDKCKANF